MKIPQWVVPIIAPLMAFPAVAQQQGEEAPASPSICETGGRFDDFDFWVGEWKVYSNDEHRAFQGSNSISRHHQDCLLVENWTSAAGRTGSSINYYDAVEDLWRQVWVADGYSIDCTGGLQETQSMVLEGRINYYATGKSQPFRGTWTPLTDGSVRQLFEQRGDDGQWTVWFDGLYVRDGSNGTR